MKKLLVLNGSHSELFLIKAAKELGFYVITTGNDPDGIGHKFSDEYYKEDFSNKEAILALAKDLKVDKVCSAANDLGLMTTSYVCEKLGIKGHDPFDITLKLHHKDKFKEFALSLGVSTPYAKFYSNKEDAIADVGNFNFPVMIKPVDMGGGKGVSKVMDISEVSDAIDNAQKVSRKSDIVIEEFIEGQLRSCTSFLQKGKIVFSFSDNEYSYLNPYLVSTSAGPADDIDVVKFKLI